MKFETVRFYDFPASYLVNGDHSGLSQEEKDLADRFVRILEKSFGPVVFEDCQEYGYGTPDYVNWDKGNLAEYTISYRG